MVLTAYSGLSPATNSSCHRRQADCMASQIPVGLSVLPRSLTPATGARTTRFDRPPHCRSSRALSTAHELLRPAISCAHDIVASTRGGIRESIVVICPTGPAADWHDGQIAYKAHAKFARRAVWASRPGYGQPLREGAASGQCPRSRRLLLLRSRQITHTEAESRANRGVERSCRIAVRHHWRTTLTGVVSGRHATRQQ